MAELRPPVRDRGSIDLLSDLGNRDLDHDGARRDLMTDPGVRDLTQDLGTVDSLELGLLAENLPEGISLVASPARSGGFLAGRRTFLGSP